MFQTLFSVKKEKKIFLKILFLPGEYHVTENELPGGQRTYLFLRWLQLLKKDFFIVIKLYLELKNNVKYIYTTLTKTLQGE